MQIASCQKNFEIYSNLLFQLKKIFYYDEIITKLELNEKVWQGSNNLIKMVIFINVK